MIWLKAFGIAVGILAFIVGAGLLIAKWDDFPEWLQAVIAILATIAALTVLVWLVLTKMLGVA